MKTNTRVAALLLGLGTLAFSGSAMAYTTSADAHKACDPKGVQYDATTKSFCCGTKGGCPAGAALKAPPAGAAAAAKGAVKASGTGAAAAGKPAAAR